MVGIATRATIIRMKSHHLCLAGPTASWFDSGLQRSTSENVLDWILEASKGDSVTGA